MFQRHTDFGNIGQSKSRICHGGHSVVLNRTKSTIVVRDHPNIISVKFGQIVDPVFSRDDEF